MPAEAIFPQEYFVYYKGKWCTAGGKDLLFGHVDGFQIDPNKIRIQQISRFKFFVLFTTYCKSKL